MAQPNLAERDYFTDESLLADPFPYYEAVRRTDRSGRSRTTARSSSPATTRSSRCSETTTPSRRATRSAGPSHRCPRDPHRDDVSALIEQYRDIFPFNENFVTFDPPQHTAHRGLMMRQLSPIRLQENERFMWRAADEEIDGFVERGSCEFVAEYA